MHLNAANESKPRILANFFTITSIASHVNINAIISFYEFDLTYYIIYEIEDNFFTDLFLIEILYFTQNINQVT